MSYLPPRRDRRRGGAEPGSESADGRPDAEHSETPESDELPLAESRAEAKQVDAERRRGLGRAFGLVTLGTLVPGLGLSLTRRRWVGLPLVVLAVAGIAFGLWYLERHGALSSALDLAARPRLLRLVAIGLIAGALVWIGSIILTAVTANPSRVSAGPRATLVVFTGLMCLLVAAPVAIGLRYIDAHTTAADRIFTGRPPAPEGRPPAPDAPNLEVTDPWEHVDRVNMLLLGTDVAEGREGVRPDSMIVASIDTASGDMTLFGIPRNLQNVPIPAGNPLSQVYPNGFDCGAECLMNGVWTAAEALAEEHPEWYADDPTPGATATREVISAVIGQPISYTVIVDLHGFQDLIDAMGGVQINVQERLPIGGQTFDDEEGHLQLVPGSESGWLEPGPQRLDGREALWYARSRVTTDDFSRMRRQRCVVAAVVQQVEPMTMLARYPEIASAAGDSVNVNISPDELPAWAELVKRVQDGSIQSLPFTTDNINVGNPDFPAMRAMVAEALYPPPPPTPTADPTTQPSPDPEPTTEPTPDPTQVDPGEPEQEDGTPTQRPEDDLADVGAVC